MSAWRYPGCGTSLLYAVSTDDGVEPQWSPAEDRPDEDAVFAVTDVDSAQPSESRVGRMTKHQLF